MLGKSLKYIRKEDQKFINQKIKEHMNQKTFQTVMDALDKLHKDIETSFDKFNGEICSMYEIKNPQDTADEELSLLDSQADEINQHDEENYKDNQA